MDLRVANLTDGWSRRQLMLCVRDFAHQPLRIRQPAAPPEPWATHLRSTGSKPGEHAGTARPAPKGLTPQAPFCSFPTSRQHLRTR